MTIKELIDYLQTLPPETDVITVRARYYGPGEEIPCTTDTLDFTDYTTNNRITNGHPAFGKKELLIGTPDE